MALEERIQREIRDKYAWQEDLRKEIDALPRDSAERENKIDLLFKLHDDIEELTEQLAS